MKLSKRKGAVVLFINKNKFLFYLRDNKPSIIYPNYWAPLGGTIEKGETPKETLKREIKEEINYNIKNPIFLGNFKDSYGNLVYVFKSRINKKINEITLNEGQKLGYFSFKEALRIKMPKYLKKFIIENKREIMNY